MFNNLLFQMLAKGLIGVLVGIFVSFKALLPAQAADLSEEGGDSATNSRRSVLVIDISSETSPFLDKKTKPSFWKHRVGYVAGGFQIGMGFGFAVIDIFTPSSNVLVPLTIFCTAWGGATITAQLYANFCCKESS